MELLLASLLFTGGLLGFGFLSRPYVERWLRLKEEAQVGRKKQQEGEPEVIPADLLAVALRYDAEWAREQSLDRLYELKSKLGSWDNVRRAFSVEENVYVMETE